MQPRRLYDKPVKLHCTWRKTLLQAPPRSTLQGEGELQQDGKQRWQRSSFCTCSVENCNWVVIKLPKNAVHFSYPKRDTNSWNSWLGFLDFSLFLHLFIYLFICMYIYDYEDKINPKPNNRLRMGKQNLVPTPKSNVQLTGQKKRKWTKGKPSYCMSTLPFIHTSFCDTLSFTPC